MITPKVQITRFGDNKARITLDGRELPSVVSYAVSQDARGPQRITVTLFADVEITEHRVAPCSKCAQPDHSGACPPAPVKCTYCRGKGSYEVEIDDGAHGFPGPTETRTCSACRGTGRVP